MKMWMDPESCRGCLRCELACSFHHSGHKFFKPTLSSTRILRNNQNKQITMILDETCDHCIDEANPFCITACVFGARVILKGKGTK